MKMRLLSIDETKELIRKNDTVLVDQGQDRQKFEESLQQILVPNETYYLHGIVRGSGSDWLVIYSSYENCFVWQTTDLSNDSDGGNEEVSIRELYEYYDLPLAMIKRIFGKGGIGTMYELEKFGEIQMIEQENGIDNLVEFEFNGQSIVNPFVSENCFDSVNPIEYYGKENFENWKKKAIEKIKGENNMQLKKETFELDGIDLGFEGYFDKNDKGWNGWLNPYFTKEVAKEIYEEIIEWENEYVKDEYIQELHYDKENKIFTMENKGKTNIYDSCKAIEIDGMELYQVGRHNFTWGLSYE